MVKINGQVKLSHIFSSYTLDTLPHTILLCGEDGCGKHLLAKQLTDEYNFGFYELTAADCNFDKLCELNMPFVPTLYYINLDKFKELQQNSILKFIEEPSAYTYIVVGTTCLSSVLTTIKGRCQIHQFEPYEKDYLLSFCSDPNVVDYCTTPGQILNSSEILVGLIDYCKSIDTKIGNASPGNILQIVAKVPEVYPYDLFIKTLLKNLTGTESYKRVLQGAKDLKTNVNKKWYLESMLLELKYIKRKNDIRTA